MPFSIDADDAKPKEACGIFGIYGPKEDVARLTYFGLYALQHRGQESAGIAYAVPGKIHCYKKMGLVSQVFNEELLAMMAGHAAIGHVRYSTTGASATKNAQPIVCLATNKKMAIAHNGNLVNAGDLHAWLESRGVKSDATSDSQVIADLIANHESDDFQTALIDVLERIQGAFSLAVLTPDKLYAVRDPMGIRPLCIGKIDDEAWIVASESCALNIVGAELVRDIEPGEVVAIGSDGEKTIHRLPSAREAMCAFEHIYFARPDSFMNDENLYDIRKRMGAILWREQPADVDLVAPIPDSATPAAIGYAHASGLPYEECLIKNRYVGRTFIFPDQRLRDVGIGIKLNPLKNVVNGKRIALVDDSIVRGSTSRKIISMLYKAGAKEIHVRVSSPPVKHPCFYGIDMATRQELLANEKDLREIKNHLGAHSIGYLSIEGMVEAIGRKIDHHCLACFDGKYPIAIPLQLQFDAKALFEKKGSQPEDSESGQTPPLAARTGR